jgi:NAD(P)H dehydrogenase (quinone)
MNKSSKKQEKTHTSQDQDRSQTSQDQDRSQTSQDRDKSQTSTDQKRTQTSTDQQITQTSQDQQRTQTSQDQQRTQTSQDQQRTQTSQDQQRTQMSQDQQTTSQKETFNIAGKKFLVIFAHPEQKSFCGMVKNDVCDNMRAKGCEVEVSDLYLMNFNPVVSPKDFTNLKNPNEFHYLEEQKNACDNNFKTYSGEIQYELDKINKADYLLFIFPLWFGSFPAIMKGWLDKCLVYGHSWKMSDGRFEGLLKGKKAMCILTCEDSEKNYTRDGSQGMTIDEILHHFNRSSMGMCGITPAKSFAFYRVSGMSDDERKKKIQNLRSELENFENRETLDVNLNKTR